MEIQVLEQSQQKILFSLSGAGHTFSNNLKHELYADEAVEVAAYKVDHPLVSLPTFIINTNGKKEIKKILTDTVKRIKEQNAILLKAIQ